MKKVLIICGPAASGKTELAKAIVAAAGSSEATLIVDSDSIRWIKGGGLLIVDGVPEYRIKNWCSMLEEKVNSRNEYRGGATMSPIMLILLTQHIPTAKEVEQFKETREYHILHHRKA